MGIKERQERDREAVAAPFSTRPATCSSPRATRTSRSARSPSASNTARPPSTATSPARTTSSSRSPKKASGCWATRRPRRGDAALETLPPLERVRAIFWRLYEFSREHPQYFALMFVDRSVPRISREYERFAFAREMKAHLVAQIQACIDAGVFPPHVNAAVAFRLLTMGLLGVAVLRLSRSARRPAKTPTRSPRDVLERHARRPAVRRRARNRRPSTSIACRTNPGAADAQVFTTRSRS